MINAITYGLCLILLSCTLLTPAAAYNPIDLINSRHYVGDYIATQ